MGMAKQAKLYATTYRLVDDHRVLCQPGVLL